LGRWPGRPPRCAGSRHRGVWADLLTGPEADYGYLILGTQAAPSGHEPLLLGALAQQTGATPVGAELSRKPREDAARLRAVVANLQMVNEKLTIRDAELAATNAELATLSEQLKDTVADLRHQATIHQVLTRAAAGGEGEQGIAAALHDLTGLAVAVEDPFGNLQAWAGPHQPDPYCRTRTPIPKPGRKTVRRCSGGAQRHSGPLRAGDQLASVQSVALGGSSSAWARHSGRLT
jgi:hypothetical protein